MICAKGIKYDILVVMKQSSFTYFFLFNRIFGLFSLSYGYKTLEKMSRHGFMSLIWDWLEGRKVT